MAVPLMQTEDFIGVAQRESSGGGGSANILDLDLDLGGGAIGINKCKNLSSCTLEICELEQCQSY